MALAFLYILIGLMGQYRFKFDHPVRCYSLGEGRYSQHHADLSTIISENEEIMALTRCPDCSSEISDQAGSCPHCGSLIDLPPTAEEKARLAAGAAGGLGCLVLIGGCAYLLSSFLDLFG